MSEKIPKGWKRCKIKNIAEIVNGGTPSTKVPEYWNGDIPWLTPKDLTNFKGRYIKKGSRNISEKGLANSSAKLLPKGTILLTSRAPIGYIAIAENKIATNQGFKNLIVDNQKVDNLFVFYWLKDNIEYLKYLGTGTTFAELNKSTIENLEIEIPKSLDEQRSIASVLSSLDDKIDLLHHQNKTLEAMAEALFRKWFIEEAKEDWEEGKLGDVIEIFDSQRIPLSKMQRDNMKTGTLYPYYGAATVMDYINDYIFDGEYILMGEDGTVRTDEGYPILQYVTGKFWVNNHAHVFRAKPPFNNFFIWIYLKKKNIDKYITGAVQPKITQTNLKSIDFPMYPLTLVEEFQRYTTPIFNKIKQNQQQIRILENLRDTLLPKLMSGEVRVRYEK